MSHGRHDYPTAIHLLWVRGRARNAIFFPPEILRAYPTDSCEHTPDLQVWESLIARACDRHAAKVHGYTWLPNEALLLLQRFSVPLRIILPSLVGQYSRHLHDTGRVPTGESPYLCRCESIQVTPELLPYALRNLYARPVGAGFCATPSKYPFCSHNLHFSESAPSWFDAQEFLTRAQRRGHVGRASVEQFLSKPESRRHAELFERLSARTARIAGELADIDDSLQLAKHSPPAPSVEQVTQVVAMLLRRESLSLNSVLGAALTTWYATRTGAATLAQMGHRFDREPTTLRADIESHRKTSGAFFELSLDEFDVLIRALVPATVALRASARPDIHRVTSMALPDSSAGVSDDPNAACNQNTPRYRVPVPTNAAIQRRGGISRAPSSAELASACMISNEDMVCHGTHSELSVAKRRHTQKGP